MGPSSTRSALTFRLAERFYALPLDRTAGVADLGRVRTVPNSPATFIGLTDWHGRVLSVHSLPALLGDRAVEVEPARSIIRLRAPLDDQALFVPARFGLAEWTPPDDSTSEILTELNDGSNLVHWIHVDALLSVRPAQATP